MQENNSHKRIDYLRISVTDRCNLRCVYCIPQEGIVHRPQEEILTFEEIVRLVRIFSSLGVTKIRLTGGETLVRKGITALIKSLVEIKGIEDVSLTTNGTLLSLYAEGLKEAGIRRINISLDTLREDRFRKITGGRSIYDVFEGIDKAIRIGFHPLKLNMVVMEGVNDDEVIDFAGFALSRGITLRFIEFMNVTPLWSRDYLVPMEEVIKTCLDNFSMEEMGRLGPGPALYYRTKQGGMLGFIKTHTGNCGMCSRLRLTSTGELKNCLYETEGLFLRESLRRGLSDEELKDIIESRMALKQYIDYRSYEVPQSYMCSVGG